MRRFVSSQRQALRIVRMSASVYLCRSIACDSATLNMRITEITSARVHYSYHRLQVMLRREGFHDNVKRVYRLYRGAGLFLCIKQPKGSKAAQLLQPKRLASNVNELWGMDFVPDALLDGRKLRMLQVVGNYTLECLAIKVGQNLKVEDVVKIFDDIAAVRGLPKTIKVENGSKFISKLTEKWAHERGIELDFGRPDKPTDNALAESFNGRLRVESLNANWFLSLAGAQTKIEAWRTFYIEGRPHSALDCGMTAEFACRD